MTSLLGQELINKFNNRAKAKKTKKTGVSLKKRKEMISWEDHLTAKGIKCFQCPGVYANEIMKFVGFRGTIDTNEICHLDMQGNEIKGEAWPPPIVPVTNINRQNLMRITKLSKKELGTRFFLGILRYEVEYMTLMFVLRNMGSENIALLMARGHGKTYIFAWSDQVKLKYFQQNIMMLSETSARRKVGNWIYLWALRNGYLKDAEKFARKSTYQHFELVNGTRMDIYKFSDEDLVGEHDYVLSLDDINKKKWESRPTENQKMIDHWQSNINFIIRSGLEIAGTRKYEGDVIGHIIDTTEDMIIMKQSPFIKCEHDNKNEDGTYDPCDICKDLCLLAPEIHGYKDLIKKMYEDFEAWYAEMMQNPKPMEGGMVTRDDIDWQRRPGFSEDIRAVGIGVDCTENELDSSDMVGIISCIMHGHDKPEFTFCASDVRKMPFRDYFDTRTGKSYQGILETISQHYDFLRREYSNVPIFIAIERQGGGLYVIREALNNRNDFPWYRKIIGERDKTKIKTQDINKLGITHNKEKTARIFSELRFPIKRHQCHFSPLLFNNTFMQQLLTFPKSKYDDGPDAAGMIKDELLKRWSDPVGPRRPREDIIQERRVSRAAAAHRMAGQPWMKGKVAKQRGARSR